MSRHLSLAHSTIQMHLYVWNDRFLYVGPSKATSLHRNHAAVWLNASEGHMQVTLADGTALTNAVVYLPSGTEYATAEASAPIAALFWEPESAGFLRIAEKFVDRPRAFACPHADSQSWVLLGKRETTLVEAEHLISKIFGLDIASSATVATMDSRISAALTFLRDSPQHYDSIESLADKAHLSPSRLAHLSRNCVPRNERSFAAAQDDRGWGARESPVGTVSVVGVLRGALRLAPSRSTPETGRSPRVGIARPLLGQWPTEIDQSRCGCRLTPAMHFPQ